jgi:hypothetical protein
MVSNYQYSLFRTIDKSTGLHDEMSAWKLLGNKRERKGRMVEKVRSVLWCGRERVSHAFQDLHRSLQNVRRALDRRVGLVDRLFPTAFAIVIVKSPQVILQNGDLGV